MSDNLQRYLPEFDDEDARNKLAGFSRDELVDMLVRAYKEKRLFAKMLDERMQKIARVEEILAQPSALQSMRGVPTPEELRKMMDEE